MMMSLDCVGDNLIQVWHTMSIELEFLQANGINVYRLNITSRKFTRNMLKIKSKFDPL